MKEHILVERYSEAFISLLDEKEMSEVLPPLIELMSHFNESQNIYEFFKDPMVKQDEKKKFLSTIFQSINLNNKTVKDFFNLLIDENRIELIREILSYLTIKWDQIQKIVQVKVQSPYNISKKMLGTIKDKIEVVTNRTANISVEINSELIAGMIISFDDKLIDLTVTKQLKNMFHK